jgi:hypothetical protein
MKRGFRLKKPACLFAVLTLFILAAGAQAQDKTEGVDLLFVQNAKDVSLGEGTLTLKGIAPTTIFFTDRPKRIAGHMTTEDFVQSWGEGEDSFAADPPNASLSVFGEEEIVDVVVTLMNPRLEGENLTYDITSLEGVVPKTSGSASLFIDPIGMPMTPTSVAGQHRRVRRHTHHRHEVRRHR